MFRADRLQQIPPYLFAELDRLKAQAQARGVDVISLGIGDPDIPTPAPIVEVMQKATTAPANHRYPPYEGTAQFREAVARYYERKYGVALNPAEEALALIGSKEGIAHVSLAVVNPGDVTLVPDPGYPVYAMGTIMAGGVPHTMPLTAENGFLPDFSKIPGDVLARAKMLFLNYPNNPTSACANLAFFEEAVAFARTHGLLLCHDNSYGEMALEGPEPPSILQVPGAKECAVEFGSLSKPFNMTGWRIGYVVGNSEAVKALGTVKNNLDSGVFMAVQEAGVYALDHGEPFIREMREHYRRRRDVAVTALRASGFSVAPPEATFYLWVPVPTGFTSKSFCAHMLEQVGIMISPGNGYGAHGEGYFRISLTAPDARLEEAMRRWTALDFSIAAAASAR